MQGDDADNSSPRTRTDGRDVVKLFLGAVLVTAVVYVIYDLIHQDFSSRYAFGFTAVGIWAFGVTTLLFVHLCRPKIQHRRKQASIALLLYFGTYVYLSSAGEYHFSQSGKIRYSFGLSVSDVAIWQPLFLHWEPFQNIYAQTTFRGSTLGYYYSPLIIIDRLWFHPTRTLITDQMVLETNAK